MVSVNEVSAGDKRSRWGLGSDTPLSALASAAATGDKRALDQILAWVVENRVARNTRYWIASPADIDEIEQLTLIKVSKKIAQYNGTGTFQGWVSMIARREALSLIRKRSQISTPIAHPEPERLNKKSARFSSAVANQQLLNEAILALSSQQDLVFNLRLDDFSHDEISEILGISTSASSTTQSEARKKLVARIRETDPDFNPAVLDSLDDNT